MSCADAGPFPFAEDVGPQPQATADGANPLEEGLGALSLLCPPSRALQGAFGRPFPRGLISRAWGRLVLAWGSRGTESGLRAHEITHEAGCASVELQFPPRASGCRPGRAGRRGAAPVAQPLIEA
jgi:hypothetical protein